MKVTTAEELGFLIRQERRAQGLTQSELAEFCGVGVNFISQVERGKPTAEIGKVLHIVDKLGLVLMGEKRSTWNVISRFIEWDDGQHSSSGFFQR